MADDAGADLVTRPGWLPREQYPFVVRRRDVAGGAVTYIDEGSGPTLLFVHAGLWSFVFRDVVTRLRADFRCVALDFLASDWRLRLTTTCRSPTSPTCSRRS